MRYGNSTSAIRSGLARSKPCASAWSSDETHAEHVAALEGNAGVLGEPLRAPSTRPAGSSSVEIRSDGNIVRDSRDLIGNRVLGCPTLRRTQD